MNITQTIRSLAQAEFEHVVQLRRTLHAHPELAFEEHQTAALVAQELTRLGIPYRTGIAQTGVVGIIEGEQPGPILALRADMDALPILEANDVPYCSTIPGKMHACGHDAHTASLIGTAAILQQLKAHIRGTIHLIFQPSEEKHPGGASVMVKEGVLNQVHSIIGQHVMPMLPVGKVGIRSGMYMASADEIYITIHGKGGHGAQPHTTIDPVTIAAQVIIALQQVISRKADPRTPSVLTFGKIIANGATNVIPDEVELIGTFRTFDESWRMKAHEHIDAIVQGITQGFGGRATVNILKGYPVLYNDEQLTAQVRKGLSAYVGEAQLVDLDLWMASEDFAFYAQEIPGCFYRIGTRNEAKGITSALHTPTFNIDEEALQLSTGLMAFLALEQLNASA